MIDITNDLSSKVLVYPVVVTADHTSLACDLQGFQSVNLDIMIGISGDTLSGSVHTTVRLQESDDDSTYTDVADNEHLILPAGITAAATTGVFLDVDAAAEDPVLFQIGYVGLKRYLKVFFDVIGATNGHTISVSAQRGDPAIRPTTIANEVATT